MIRLALICALILAAGPAWADHRLITHKQLQANDDTDFALAYQVNHTVSAMDEGETPLEDLQEDTGCNADGVGPAQFGCDVYQATGTQSSRFNELKVRGGVNRNQVGVGINLTW